MKTYEKLWLDIYRHMENMVKEYRAMGIRRPVVYIYEKSPHLEIGTQRIQLNGLPTTLLLLCALRVTFEANRRNITPGYNAIFVDITGLMEMQPDFKLDENVLGAIIFQKD